MKQEVARWSHAIIMNLVLLFLSLGLVLVLGRSAAPLTAQESATDMRALLEHLNAQMTDEVGFQVAIRFAVPLIPDDDLAWVLPDRIDSETDQITRSIAEIGDDYVCFDVFGGAARFIECTPFSNIVSVRYFVE